MLLILDEINLELISLYNSSMQLLQMYLIEESSELIELHDQC